MFITYLHICFIVLTLIPTIIVAWLTQKGRFKGLNFASSVCSLICAYLLAIPTGIDEFGFNHLTEFLLWLIAIALISIAVLVIFFINFKKRSSVFEFVLCLLAGVGLMITGIVEQYYILNALAAALIFINIAKLTAATSNKAK